MRTFLADLRYGVRALFRVPSFAIAIVAILALGIGANTAIFSIVNTVLLRPAGEAALRQAYHAFTAMSHGFEARLGTK